MEPVGWASSIIIILPPGYCGQRKVKIERETVKRRTMKDSGETGPGRKNDIKLKTKSYKIGDEKARKNRDKRRKERCKVKLTSDKVKSK